MTTGIITFHCADNLGAVLQVYALQKKLEELNISSEIIDFRPINLTEPYDNIIEWNKSIKKLGILRTFKTNIIKSIYYRKTKKRKLMYKKFREKNLIVSKKTYFTSEELRNNPPKYDYYITGSDQIWNPEFFVETGESYFLDFAPNESVKISYAASIAKDIGTEYDSIFRENMDRFNHISIRESEHLDFLSRLTDKPVNVTLDPTLLLDQSLYEGISSKPNVTDKYILVYDILFNKELMELANRISREKGYKVISFQSHKKYNQGIKSFQYEGPEEFLGYIEKAELVLSTSFHGVAFSIIYNKPFYTIPHPTRGSRMLNLLAMLGLEDRIIYNAEDLGEIGYIMNYSRPQKLLDEKRNFSVNYLISALRSDVI